MGDIPQACCCHGRASVPINMQLGQEQRCLLLPGWHCCWAADHVLHLVNAYIPVLVNNGMLDTFRSFLTLTAGRK
jgi:hypothetical protein